MIKARRFLGLIGLLATLAPPALASALQPEPFPPGGPAWEGKQFVVAEPAASRREGSPASGRPPNLPKAARFSHAPWPRR